MAILGNLQRKERTFYENFDFDKDLLGLKVMHGEEPGRIYNLSREVQGCHGCLTVGWYDAKDPHRNVINIVEKQSSYISRCHASIEKDGKKKVWILKDGQKRRQTWCPSTNGTLLNAKDVDANGMVIQPGDIITMGDTTLKVVTKPRF